GLGIRHIALADDRHSAIGGSPVVLLGYPTGVDAILARTGAATLQAIAASSKGDPKQAMEELERHHLIKPVVTQGHIGDVLPDKSFTTPRRPRAVPVARSSMIKVRS